MFFYLLPVLLAATLLRCWHSAASAASSSSNSSSSSDASSSGCGSIVLVVRSGQARAKAAPDLRPILVPEMLTVPAIAIAGFDCTCLLPDGTFKLTSVTNLRKKKLRHFCGVLTICSITCLKLNLLRSQV